MAKIAQKKIEQKAAPPAVETSAERQEKIAELEKAKDKVQLKLDWAEGEIKGGELVERSRNDIRTVAVDVGTLAQVKYYFGNEAAKESMKAVVMLLEGKLVQGIKTIRPDMILQAGKLARAQDLQWDEAKLKKVFSDGIHGLETPLKEMLESTRADVKSGKDLRGVLNEFINHYSEVKQLAFVKSCGSKMEDAERIMGLANTFSEIISKPVPDKEGMEAAWKAVSSIVETEPEGGPAEWVKNLRCNVEGLEADLVNNVKKYGETFAAVTKNADEFVALQKKAKEKKLKYKVPADPKELKKDIDGFRAELDKINAQLRELYAKEAAREAMRNIQMLSSFQKSVARNVDHALPFDGYEEED